MAIENPLEHTNRRSWINCPLLSLLWLVVPGFRSCLSVGDAVLQGRPDVHELCTDFSCQRSILFDSWGGRVTNGSLNCFLVRRLWIVSLQHDVPVAACNLGWVNFNWVAISISRWEVWGIVRAWLQNYGRFVRGTRIVTEGMEIQAWVVFD